jgi:hypothetical protein
MLRVVTPGGRILTSPDLVGAVLDTVDEDGRAITVRIDTVAQDPTDLSGDIWLHGFSVLDHEAGLWREFCQSAPDGTRAGFPLAGRWTTDMRHLPASSSFTLTCTSGASGKYVRMGYKPWRKVGTDSLWEYHQACVRVIRADYGGDGISHTRDGPGSTYSTGWAFSGGTMSLTASHLRLPGQPVAPSASGEPVSPASSWMMT